MAQTSDPDAGAPEGPPENDSLPGTLLGDYRVEKAIAWGGMGIVYLAVHPLIGRKVAVKVLRPSFASDPDQVSRFLSEAKAISSIKHRGIIDIIGFGKLPDGRQYMVMEFLDGETLEAVMQREGAMVPARALALIEELLDALSAAHKAGVVHRDLKPANVYICLQSNGAKYVKLVDFGLARRASIADLNRGGGKASIMAGTPEYFSPEQARGTAATPRTDLYGLGVMLFEMVTGELPFKQDSVIELLNAHLTQLAPRASTKVDGLPEAVDALIAQLLEKQPELRPLSADSVRQTVIRLSRQLKDEATKIQVVGPPPEDEKTGRVVPSKDTDRLPIPALRPSNRPPAPSPSSPRRSLGGAAARRVPDAAPKLHLVTPQTPELAASPRAADTEPRLPSRAGWKRLALGAAVVICAVIAAIWAATPAAPPPPVVGPVLVAPEPVAVPEPVVAAAVPIEPLPPADEAPVPLKRPPPRVARPAETPSVCEEKNWKATLRKELGRLDLIMLQGGRPKEELDAAIVEEKTLDKRITSGQSRVDCSGIARDVSAFKTRHGL